jgi:hypothetical protein
MRRNIVFRLVRTGALAFALVGLAGPAAAQQPSAAQIQIARDIVEASGANRSFEPIVPSILQQAVAMFVQQNPDLQQALIETAQTIRPEFDKRRVEIVEIVSRVYASRFTEAELKELLAFYRSTVGRKYVSILPSVLDESFNRTQQWSAKISEEIVNRMRAEMKRRGHNI